MSSAYDITTLIKPPRTAYLDYLLGNAVGRPEEPEEQRTILRAALSLLQTAREPGELVELPNRWPDPDWVAELNEQYEREAEIVFRQRSEGEYDPAPDGGEPRHYAAEEAESIVSIV